MTTEEYDRTGGAYDRNDGAYEMIDDVCDRTADTHGGTGGAQHWTGGACDGNGVALDMPGAYDRRFTVYVPERVPAYKVQRVSMHRAVGWSWWKLCVVDIHAE